MILVRQIGMSGYVPLEGVISLLHSPLDYIFWAPDFCKRKCISVCQFKCTSSFVYLSAVDRNRTTNKDVLSKAVSFVVFKRFGVSILSTVAKDVGLLSGYFGAGPLLSRNLFRLLVADMGLSHYRDLAYIPYIPANWRGEFLCSTVWAEYIRIDPDLSHVAWSPIDISVLGLVKPFPNFIREGFRFFEVRDMLRC